MMLEYAAHAVLWLSIGAVVGGCIGWLAYGDQQ
jgi:hypothetical protein